MVNFEPWKVETFMKEYGHDDSSIFQKVLKTDKVKLDRADYIQIL